MTEIKADYGAIGRKLKELRKERMLTLKQLEEKTEISAGYISKIERGTVNPSIQKIQKICFALGITANELMIEQKKAEPDIHQGKSYVLRKSDRIPIYGITGAMVFESVFEEDSRFKIDVLTLAGNMQEQYYSVHSFDEFGIVAKGKLGINLGDTEYYELEEGEGILIRSGTKHIIVNGSSEETVTYWIEIAGHS